MACEVNDPLLTAIDEPEKRSRRSESGAKSLSFAAEAKGDNEFNTPNTYKPKCTLCSEPHGLWNCPTFLAKSDLDRLAYVRNKELCFNCLRYKHKVRECFRARNCEVQGCKDWHSTLLHEAFQLENDPGTVNTPNPVLSSSSSSMTSLKSELQSVSLPILRVTVCIKGTRVATLALLDSGSNSTYCDPTLSQELDCEELASTLNLNTLNGGKCRTSKKVSLELLSANKRKLINLNQVYVLDKPFPSMSSCIPVASDVSSWKHLQHIDVNNMSGLGVKLVIGNNNSHCLLPQEVSRRADDEPFAVRTVLGWGISRVVFELFVKVEFFE